ncbi:MAG: twin-arginine translocase TatA/TatE family subunit [Proteobacteria bacterium]|nr:twin-arginine translocase TatA/TatE family subunit [Pseudomonadota bacterium]NIS67962.1 twin-arginine translocase TatA/TatE family subunit [Pseudomonadota bacterium]
MFGLGFSELIIIGVIVLLIFGARRLPEIGRGLGKTVKEIRNISRDAKKEGEEDASSETGAGPKPEKKAHSKSRNLKDKIGDLPGVEEIKSVQETASQVRKWWRFIKR